MLELIDLIKNKEFLNKCPEKLLCAHSLVELSKFSDIYSYGYHQLRAISKGAYKLKLLGYKFNLIISCEDKYDPKLAYQYVTTRIFAISKKDFEIKKDCFYSGKVLYKFNDCLVMYIDEEVSPMDLLIRDYK